MSKFDIYHSITDVWLHQTKSCISSLSIPSPEVECFYQGNSGWFLGEVDVNMLTKGRASKQMVF